MVAVMRVLVLPFLFVCVTAFFLDTSSLVEWYKGFHWEYHTNHKLLIIQDNAHCYLVDGNDDLLAAFLIPIEKHHVQDELVHLIKEGNGMSVTSLDDIRHDYHDYLGAAQCIYHAVYKLMYYYVPVVPTHAPDTTTTFDTTTTPDLTTIPDFTTSPDLTTIPDFTTTPDPTTTPTTPKPVVTSKATTTVTPSMTSNPTTTNPTTHLMNEISDAPFVFNN